MRITIGPGVYYQPKKVDRKIAKAQKKREKIARGRMAKTLDMIHKWSSGKKQHIFLKWGTMIGNSNHPSNRGAWTGEKKKKIIFPRFDLGRKTFDKVGGFSSRTFWLHTRNQSRYWNVSWNFYGRFF